MIGESDISVKISHKYSYTTIQLKSVRIEPFKWSNPTPLGVFRNGVQLEAKHDYYKFLPTFNTAKIRSALATEGGGGFHGSPQIILTYKEIHPFANLPNIAIPFLYFLI